MIIAIDFDGTITKEHRYPRIGVIDTKAIEVIKKIKRKHTICLWTCRDGEALQEVVDTLEQDYGLVFDYINDSPYSTGSRKIVADYYIDDRAFGGVIDWYVIEKHLC